MVKIKSTTIFQAVFLLLKYSDVIAVPILTPTTLASTPIQTEVYHSGNVLTNRRMMVKSERFSQELAPMSPPPPQVIDKLLPNEDQARAIKHAKDNQQRGVIYRVAENGELTEEPKDACDPNHFCGKMIFRNEDGILLDETGCCHCNSSCLGVRPSNSAETLICCGICCGPIVAGGVCACLWDIDYKELWKSCKCLRFGRSQLDS